MFIKNSRYARLPDIVTTDRAGRTLPSKSLRLLPDVAGDFQHPIDDNDRLDHLAYKDYHSSERWWHICDANPEFLSPLALLGKEPLHPTRFRVVWNDTDGPPPCGCVLTAADTDLSRPLAAAPASPDAALPMV
ncbi:MAG: hypothetical protein KDE19_07015 [Caldilineaceae bacterium]|nr:hypothetical protein [Caldilineaceae bacterium]